MKQNIFEGKGSKFTTGAALVNLANYPLLSYAVSRVRDRNPGMSTDALERMLNDPAHELTASEQLLVLSNAIDHLSFYAFLFGLAYFVYHKTK